jgi:hypothetical protein
MRYSISFTLKLQLTQLAGTSGHAPLTTNSCRKLKTDKLAEIKAPFFIFIGPIRRDSVVGIATSYGLDDREVGVRVPGSRIFSSPRRPDRLWGPPSLLSNWYRRLTPGVKWQGREADHSPPTSEEVKKM